MTDPTEVEVGSGTWIDHVRSSLRESGVAGRAVSMASWRRASSVGRPALRTVTPLGWTVLALGIAAWICGAELGWKELLIIAATCLLVLALSVLFVVGRASLQIGVELEPRRVVAGQPAAGRIIFENRSSRRMIPSQVELPVGEGLAAFDVASLAGGGTAEELFVVPTERRGVIPVGPASSVRGDPLGLLQRKAVSGSPLELIVHPVTVPLVPFGTGLLRDLEGLTTKEVSVSDLAFHSLREYEPGDDSRYVHWRSSAKAGRLLVRQFLDTRRSALSVLVDGRTESYTDAEEFEVALQVAGSLAVRASQDDLQTVLVAGGQAASGTVRYLLLDALARAELVTDGPDLSTLAGRSVARAGDTTLAVVISGSASSSVDLQRAATRFAPEVRVVAIRIVPAESPGMGSAGRVTILRVGALRDLPAMVSAGSIA